ncbi:carbohydrate kinase [Mangrovibacillus cuniculi]|uniref:Winged helix-turn-helix transcriptional regulator n=1 Tax=Mangrovibacillus cuniculi TaxID=2593652 RepID=A0A7S8C9C3_9BACI|nr:carbohydrate kinase [Mangrovibacillus cuniculi]QPC45753.1 winged helix-turn-helix transcriptional regulator [Mangrovibacillus cuniculi]
MNEKEKVIYDSIKENPFVSQQEIAEKTGLSRSAVAGYISSLIKTGHLLGRAYILPNQKGIVCLGGANIDRKLHSDKPLSSRTTNEVETSHFPGGIARNIAETLGRLGLETKLVSVVGDDAQSKWLMEHSQPYVDTSFVQTLPNKLCGTYTAVIDQEGNTTMSFSDMSIYNEVDIGHIQKKWTPVRASDMVVVDTNFSAEVVKYIIRTCKQEEIPVVLVPPATGKIDRVPSNLDGVDWFICHQEVAEILTGKIVEEESDALEAARLLVEKGAKHVIIYRNHEPLVYHTYRGEVGLVIPPVTKVIDFTGSADLLAAGVIYGLFNDLRLEECCKLGLACAALSHESRETVPHTLQKKKLQEKYLELFS